jgi:hypothetical protein
MAFLGLNFKTLLLFLFELLVIVPKVNSDWLVLPVEALARVLALLFSGYFFFDDFIKARLVRLGRNSVRGSVPRGGSQPFWDAYRHVAVCTERKLVILGPMKITHYYAPGEALL